MQSFKLHDDDDRRVTLVSDQNYEKVRSATKANTPVKYFDDSLCEGKDLGIYQTFFKKKIPKI